jgi:hypothetical protein
MTTQNNFRLSVLRPLVQSGGTVVEVFLISVPQGLQWVRDHADELAGLCCPGVAYCALNVEHAP